MLKVTVQESILVAAPVEKVWDFTQDWSRRPEWDESVSEVLLVVDEPRKRVKARFSGDMVFDVEYKLNERPRMTSLVMTNGGTKWVSGGGGSWRYESRDTGTEWTQTNTLVLREGTLTRLAKPLVKWSLRRATRKAMTKAKRMVEAFA